VGFAAGLFALCSAPRPARAQALSGFDVYRSNCGGCHDLYDPETPARTRKAWDTILTRMVKVRGATLNTQEYNAVLNYLDSFNRPHREIKWVDAPARTHKAAFAAPDAGKLPADWVDITVGGDSQVPWAVQADPAAKAFYLSPLKTVGEGEYPVLIDNTGIVNNGAASVRAEILSGKGAVGAGLVFGFRNPQSYFGVRFSGRDIVLYEVQSGQRALLARAPTSLPLKEWHALSVDVADRNVKVSLDGKPVPELSRPLNDYRGGKLGVHTQGDTVALFDQWQVTVR
jgi:hypothetical protein